MAELNLKDLLSEIGMPDYLANFEKENIDINICKSLTDADLVRLGLTTIGERVRFREGVGKYQTRHDRNQSRSTAEMAASLFRPSRSRFQQATRQPSGPKKKARTWTGQFVCLADKNASKVPSSSDKVNLQRSGLGKKSIQFYVTESETNVHDKLVVEFEKLSGAAGFELLRCQSNCRHLEKLECRWDVNSLKTNVGSQAKIYIRPIQKDLTVNPVEDFENKIKESCSFCNKEFPINLLRKHFESCLEQSLATAAVANHAATNITENLHSNSMPFVEDLPTLDLDDVAEVISENDNEVVVQEDKGSSEVDDVVNECVSYCKAENISDPVSILKIFQKMIVTGRPLEVDEYTQTNGLDGETNYIIVDRDNIIRTALEEVASICDMRKCLEVQFYGEAAVDYGGPRKEFFAIVLQQIQKEYFDPIREWSDDYETVGKIMALSMVQNGKLPRVMSSELIEELFESPSPRNFVKDLQKGLNSLGICKLVNEMPTFVHLFTPVQQTALTLKMMTCILKPMFSEEKKKQGHILHL